MKSAFAALALFVSAALAQSTLTINTPANVVECEPTLLSWSGGTPPYFLSVLPGSSPGSAALENLGQQSGTSFTWNTNIASGTNVGLTLRDSTGQTASSAPFSINAGSSSACLTSSAGGSSTAAGSSSSAAGSSSAAASSSSASTPASSAPPTSSKPTSTAPAATSTTSTSASTPSSSASKPTSSSTGSTSASGSQSTNAASLNFANMGLAGVAGAAVMAVLA